MDVEPIRIGRFVLTKMTAADSEKYYHLSNNDDVMKYVTGYALNRAQSDEMLRSILEEYGSDTYLGRYLIEVAESAELIGVAKLDRSGFDIEIGYRIRFEYWGKGIATEIATGLIHFAKNNLRAANVIAFVNVDNAASVRVLEKAGMKNVETMEDIDEVKYKFIYIPQKRNGLRKVLSLLVAMAVIALIVALVSGWMD
ncbi:GNAT family N-acetyltransferase [Dyadobacter crusticola]|uniref:GNAT family N-acetyltransferase n=1 Tax=Dyadobacter crusticola TaxID=292407 RepID=UPI0006921C26|nr:GNAT family N-acetyltransferase [Dyadobacter crusticola]